MDSWVNDDLVYKIYVKIVIRPYFMRSITIFFNNIADDDLILFI